MTDLFRGLDVPPPSAALRPRILAEALAAAQESAPHWIDRVYEDIALRRATFVLVLALLAALVLAMPPGDPNVEWRARSLDEQAPPAEDPGSPAPAQWCELARELGLAGDG